MLEENCILFITNYHQKVTKRSYGNSANKALYYLGKVAFLSLQCKLNEKIYRLHITTRNCAYVQKRQYLNICDDFYS